jgi:4-diphosphocytidyl-2-C-methyl-D-erythritol kinase
LVHPGVPVATKGVFEGLGIAPGERRLGAALPELAPTTRDALLALLAAHGNDLEAPAILIEPVIADVATALRAVPGCRFARMSGSGSACFGVFGSLRVAQAAARKLSHAHPSWWVRATMLG